MVGGADRPRRYKLVTRVSIQRSDLGLKLTFPPGMFDRVGSAEAYSDGTGTHSGNGICFAGILMLDGLVQPNAISLRVSYVVLGVLLIAMSNARAGR
jgi:hypothetical protein